MKWIWEPRLGVSRFIYFGFRFDRFWGPGWVRNPIFALHWVPRSASSPYFGIKNKWSWASFLEASRITYLGSQFGRLWGPSWVWNPIFGAFWILTSASSPHFATKNKWSWVCFLEASRTTYLGCQIWQILGSKLGLEPHIWNTWILKWALSPHFATKNKWSWASFLEASRITYLVSQFGIFWGPSWARNPIFGIHWTLRSASSQHFATKNKWSWKPVRRSLPFMKSRNHWAQSRSDAPFLS